MLSSVPDSSLLYLPVGILLVDPGLPLIILGTTSCMVDPGILLVIPGSHFLADPGLLAFPGSHLLAALGNHPVVAADID